MDVQIATIEIELLFRDTDISIIDVGPELIFKVAEPGIEFREAGPIIEVQEALVALEVIL